jgi:hypothetical protein
MGQGYNRWTGFERNPVLDIVGCGPYNHAFRRAGRGFLDNFTDEERALSRRFAAAIVDRRMAMPAVLFLEGMRPMNFVGSQFLHFFNPMLGVVFNYRDLEALALFLEKRQSLEMVVKDIEELEKAREEREAEEKRERKLERQRARGGEPRRGLRRLWPF